MMDAEGARCSQTAGRSSQNHATLPRLMYVRLFAAGRPSRVGPYDSPGGAFFKFVAAQRHP